MDLFQKKENKMKLQQKIVLMILTIFLSTLLSLNVYALDTPKTIVERYRSISSVSEYLYTYYEYESDTKQFDCDEYWQTPEQMIENKKGDCEDFAILTQAILKELGIESKLIGLYWQEEDYTKTYKWVAHMILMIQEVDNKYSFMSNQFYFATLEESIEKSIERYVENWYSYTIFSPDGTEIETVDNKNWIDEEQENEETKSVDTFE